MAISDFRDYSSILGIVENGSLEFVSYNKDVSGGQEL